MASIQCRKPTEHKTITHIEHPIAKNCEKPSSTEKHLNKPDIHKSEHSFGEKVKDAVQSVAKKMHRKKKNKSKEGNNDSSSESGSSSSSSESESDDERKTHTKKTAKGTGKKKAADSTSVKKI